MGHGVGVARPARLGQLGAARRAVEQLRAELLLDLAGLDAQRLLGEVQPSGGA
jgi:hypothetical protein